MRSCASGQARFESLGQTTRDARERVPATQCGCRPIFNAILRAAASWLFFRVARSTHMNPDMGSFVTASPARTAMKKSQLTCGDVAIVRGTVP